MLNIPYRLAPLHRVSSRSPRASLPAPNHPDLEGPYRAFIFFRVVGRWGFSIPVQPDLGACDLIKTNNAPPPRPQPQYSRLSERRRYTGRPPLTHLFSLSFKNRSRPQKLTCSSSGVGSTVLHRTGSLYPSRPPGLGWLWTAVRPAAVLVRD